MTDIYHNHLDVDRGDCSTVIFGKDASVTGKVIMAHNEDDTDVYVQTHLVPRKEHKEGKWSSLRTARPSFRRFR